MTDEGTAYFAYGANILLDGMVDRCPGARLVGPARLGGHRFRITRHGVATVVEAPDAAVWGLLWMLTDEHLQALDRFEGVAHGFYRRALRPVAPGSGPPVDAVIYVAADAEPGRPRSGYLEPIVAAAGVHGFPVPYRDELRAWL